MSGTATGMTRPMKMPLIRELDGIRAIAVLIVFLSHLHLGNVIPGGLGVTIFFFLSGYLITSLLRAEGVTNGKIAYGAFYARRTLRIFPPLYITLGLSALAVAAGLVRTDVDPKAAWSQILFVSNYAKLWGIDRGLPGPPLWSLAVEEHFYLIFPWIFGLFLMKRSPRFAAMFCFILCLVVLDLRILTAQVTGDVTINYFLSHTRVDSILFGSCLAMWQNPALDGEDRWKPRLWQAVLAGLAVLGAAMVRNEYFGDTLRYTIQGAALFVVFAWVLNGNRFASAVLNNAVLQIIGRYSYTLYLSHGLALQILETLHPEWHIALIGLVGGLISLVYSALMFWIIERPLAKLRHKLHSEPAPAPEFPDAIVDRREFRDPDRPYPTSS
jgi:peptidoglycan/LPS O-acetylase OafA/YrhL